MQAARWARIDDLFDRASSLGTAARDAFLDAECGDDADLRAEIASLLASTDGAAGSIRDVVAGQAADLAYEGRAAKIGRRVGAFRLQSLLGQGGMGAVYLATRDDASFSQRVAIKILSTAMHSPAAVARFRDERQILAALEHPNIVRLLDGGSTEDDQPFLAMEYIEGTSITRYATAQMLSIRARIGLVRDVCAALQHAHRNLVIHRDIKPSNILVDATGIPKLLDFGIAKLLVPAPDREAHTRTGLAMFTPEYASPEQATNQPVTTATDVYSLGAVLYELLAGRPPHRHTGDLLETIRLLRDVEPTKPSVIAPVAFRREVAGDLDRIVLKALHKEPASRYLSIDELDRDLLAFLDGRPVSARTPTFTYRARKFVRRNTAGVAAAALVLVALVAGTVISLRQAARADAQARRADSAAINAQHEATRALSEAERARRAETAARDAEARVQQQLDDLRTAHAARERAEQQTREALASARKDQTVAEQESRRARTAEQRAADTAELERKTREQAEALAARERVRAESAEKQSKQITTKLP